MVKHVIAPLITPVTREGEVCRASVRRLVRSLLPSVDGLVVCLTSGEGWRLDERRWVSTLEATIDQAEGLPVIAGIEQPTTDRVLAFAQRARELGAAGVMLTSPFGTEVGQASILEHYRRVHDAADLDIYIYNESSLSGNETTFATLLSIASLPRVVGIKDSVEQGRAEEQIAALRAQGLKYYIGWEHHLGTGVPSDGCVVSLANLEPTLCRLALAMHSEALRTEVNRLTDHYSLRSDDWYAHIKKELFGRGVISTPQVVGI